MMSLTVRKVIVLGLIGSILLIGNILFVANWLADKGVVDWAKNIRTDSKMSCMRSSANWFP